MSCAIFYRLLIPITISRIIEKIRKKLNENDLKFNGL